MATHLIGPAEVAYTLAGNLVHVWRIPLEVDAAPAHLFSELLTAGEKARAARYVRDEDRCRFQIARAATRCLLGRYLDLPATKVGIELDPRGKPQLDAATLPPGRSVHFNVSHSGGWILAAFAHAFPVGIDIESVRATAATEEMIKHLMSDRERERLRALPQDRQIAGFFHCWSSKEALLKGLGVGVTVPLRAIEVSIDPEQPAQLIAAPPALRADDWRLHRLEFPAAYAAVLAVAAKSVEILDIGLESWRQLGC
jgi:4'-phosphopantetheinyl transferase